MQSPNYTLLIRFHLSINKLLQPLVSKVKVLSSFELVQEHSASLKG